MSQSNLTIKEIESLIKKKHDTELFAYKKTGTIKGLGDFEEVSQQGGEGQGDHWESVKYFKDRDLYIKVTGTYQSYNGTDFYSYPYSIVKPVVKQVTFYE